MTKKLTEEQAHFLKALQEEATKQEITIVELLEKLDRRNKLIDAIPKFDRLNYLEELVRQGEISSDFMDITLRTTPILPEETRKHFETVRKELSELFGVEVPKYELKFKRTLGQFGKASGLTDCFGTIWLPSRGGQFLPITIAHEHAHAYHAENGALYKMVRELDSRKDKKRIAEIKSDAYHLIEGWASFASLVYAQNRDSKGLGKMYEETLRNANIMGELIDFAQRNDSRAGYYKGMETYERLFAKRGLQGVLHAVRNLITDKELADFSAN